MSHRDLSIRRNTTYVLQKNSNVFKRQSGLRGAEQKAASGNEKKPNKRYRKQYIHHLH